MKHNKKILPELVEEGFRQPLVVFFLATQCWKFRVNFEHKSQEKTCPLLP